MGSSILTLPEGAAGRVLTTLGLPGGVQERNPACETTYDKADPAARG